MATTSRGLRVGEPHPCTLAPETSRRPSLIAVAVPLTNQLSLWVEVRVARGDPLLEFHDPEAARRLFLGDRRPSSTRRCAVPWEPPFEWSAVEWRGHLPARRPSAGA